MSFRFALIRWLAGEDTVIINADLVAPVEVDGFKRRAGIRSSAFLFRVNVKRAGHQNGISLQETVNSWVRQCRVYTTTEGSLEERHARLKKDLSHALGRRSRVSS